MKWRANLTFRTGYVETMNGDGEVRSTATYRVQTSTSAPFDYDMAEDMFDSISAMSIAYS